MTNLRMRKIKEAQDADANLKRANQQARDDAAELKKLKQTIQKQEDRLEELDQKLKATVQFEADAKHTIKALHSTVKLSMKKLPVSVVRDFKYLHIAAEFAQKCGLESFPVHPLADYLQNWKSEYPKTCEKPPQGIGLAKTGTAKSQRTIQEPDGASQLDSTFFQNEQSSTLN